MIRSAQFNCLELIAAMINIEIRTAFDFEKNVLLSNILWFAPVAQLDRVSDYESEGREFESLRAHHFSLLRLTAIS